MSPRGTDTPSDYTADVANATARALLRSALAQRAPEAFLDADEAAVYVGVARGTLRNLVSRGALKADGRGRTNVYRRSTLDAFLASRRRVRT